MQNSYREAVLVLTLFIGYFALWKFKNKSIINDAKINPEVIQQDPRPTQRLFKNISRLLTISVIILIILHGLDISDIPGFYRINWLDRPLFDFAGLGLGIAGLLMCLVAQREMGNSWRVGIDQELKTNLVTSGIYRYLRNPTYTGLFIMTFGVWVIFATMSSLLWAVVFYIALEYQVRLEEEYLTSIHGDKYIKYYQDTKRYIPFFY